jgi:hypothetical protein
MRHADHPSQNYEPDTEEESSILVHDALPVLQSIWVRHCSISINDMDWKSLVSQFKFVWFSGIVFYIIYFLSILFQ